MTDLNDQSTEAHVAIVGLSGRFPGAQNCEEFWTNLANGVESLSHFEEEELIASGIDPKRVRLPEYVRKRFILEDVDLWDASFFGVTANEARMMDPQQRLFLECAYEALEIAGHKVGSSTARVGLFAGSSPSSYRKLWKSNPEFAPAMDSFAALLANDREHLVTKVSYKLDLRGPGISVSTACSTSLVAVAMACQSLISGECDLALAGGCSIHLPQVDGLVYQEGGINSPDGHCRPFDAAAAGTVSGSGVGVAVLKRLEDAVADGNTIHAVIKGWAINNDGNSKVGYTAPSVDGQAEVIAMAQALANVTPDTIDYVETHGTATYLGDQIEAAALIKAFKSSTGKKQFCAIGSVKSNIGHLDAAAGIAGLFKVVLGLRNCQIPPSLNFHTPNPRIDFENSPFFVNTRLRPWNRNGRPRRAGVSSFGVGGTNAHVVLEEAPPSPPSSPGRSHQVLLLSAKTEEALAQSCDEWTKYLQQSPTSNLADIAYTSQTGRKAYAHRKAVVCSDHASALAALSERSFGSSLNSVVSPGGHAVVFLCAGQGAQSINMGRQLREQEPVFREKFDQICALLDPALREKVLDAMFPLEAVREVAVADLTQTEIAQPALFCLEYALAETWRHWGVKPEAFIGHSLGEYVAACLAGVFTPKDALQLVSARGRLMQKAAPGGMLAVNLPLAEAQEFVSTSVGIAAVNAPSWTVLSGPLEPLQHIEREIQKREIHHRRLHTSHAFHSFTMNPILDYFRRELEAVRLSPPQIPYISNVTGTWITAEQATDTNYWVRQLREPVRFLDGVGELLHDPGRVYLEVGPGETLGPLVRSCGADTGSVISSLPRSQQASDEIGHITTAIARLWLAGIEIDWQRYHAHERRLRLPLPTNPFQRQSYWIPTIPPARKKEQDPLDAVEPSREKKSIAVESDMKPTADSAQLTRVKSELENLLSKAIGSPASAIRGSDNLASLGFDSLLLIQVAGSIKKAFNVKVPFRSLVEEFRTIDALAAHVTEKLVDSGTTVNEKRASAEHQGVQVARSRSHHQEAVSVTPVAPLGSQDQRYHKIEEQLADLARQLETLRQSGTSNGTPTESSLLAGENHAPIASKAAPGSTAVGTTSDVNPHYVPFQPIKPYMSSEIAATQQRYIDAFITRYCRRTAASKKSTQAHRKHLADNRALLGFRLPWKELAYPIVAKRSSGSRFWDLDGNEYVDLTMGFGVHLFGHSPSFVTESLQQQLQKGFALGPQSELAGEVAQHIAELSGTERVAFCNSGTEAVASAIRLARAVTGRTKIATFAGAYHGTFDAILGRLAPGDKLGIRSPIPVSPGVAASAMDDLVVVPYGSSQTLEILQSQAGELAAVLVEPVQSRRPDIQPREFLQQLRSLTHRSESALIFDDMITGFRLAQGGTQEWYGIKADLVTYGKVIGGGMPVGVIAGATKFLNGIDGGWWQYGDSSYPKEDQILFAGTFFRHPLSMAAALAVARYLKAEGSALQKCLNERATNFVADLNACLVRNCVPMRVVNCGSLIRFLPTGGSEYLDLFFYHLIEKGVYIWEGRTSFLSTAHSNSDLLFVLDAFEQSGQQMRTAGFFAHETSTPNTAAAPPELLKPQGKENCATLQTIPISQRQQQLWALSQTGEDACSAYNSSITLKLKGALDVNALVRAIEKVVKRHEALRVTFSNDGQWQYVHQNLSPELEMRNLSYEKQAELDAAGLVLKQARTPFDLERGPLLRLAIVKIGPESHWLVITAHHLIFDGWSSSVLINELNELYRAEKDGTPPRLASVTPLRELVEPETRSGHPSSDSLSYWRERLDGQIPVLELPTDWARPVVQTYDGERAVYSLSRAVTNSVKNLQNREGWTMFAVLFASFNVLLHRLSGQDDIICGIPTAAQAGMDEANVIGYGVNVLPIRSRLTVQPRFRDYVTATQARVLEACDHQNVSLLSLVKHLGLRRDPSRSPLVTVLFNLDHSGPIRKIFDTDAEVVANSNGTSKFDMDWNIIDSDGKLLVECDFNTSMFSESTMQRWMRHFETLLAAVTADPDLKLSEIPLLNEADRSLVIGEFNRTAVDYEFPGCIPQQIERHVKVSPNATAVVFRGNHLSYADLNNRANHVAQLLVRSGASTRSFVPILMDRGLGLVPALLGVMKLGAAYVPLDSRWPDDRLRQVIEELRCPVIVADTDSYARAADLAQTVLNIDEPPQGCEAPPPNVQIDPAMPIYAIYTSGSTGRPKAAINHHRGIVNRFLWMDECFGVESAAAALQTTPHIYDSSVWQLFWPLAHGGRTVLPHDEGELVATAASALIEANGVTISDFAFSVFDAMLPDFLTREEMSRKLSSLRVLIIGSEAVRLQPVAAFHKRFPEIRLFNIYGPTEASIGCIYYELTGEENGRLPIGKPIANVQVYILDEWMQPVPIGVAGEIYLGGACIGGGYFNAPALTSAAFIQNPFGPDRLYKTGDLARYAADGTIEYLGRKDQQVKIFGIRIELGDIEAVLSQHPAVQRCVVSLREDVPHEKRLAGYAVSRTGVALPSGSDLNAFLKKRLPTYMLPATMTWLPELPRTAANKIDRSRLPAPEPVQRVAEPAAPRNAVEKQLAQIWADVLRIPAVGIHDNFFELGGDSILAIHIVSKANNAGIRLNPKLIFQYQTVAELALASGAAVAPQAEQGIVAGAIPLTPIAHRFFERILVDPHHHNQAFLFQSSEPLDTAQIEEALRRLMEHHDVLRLQLDFSGNRWVQINGSASRTLFELFDFQDLRADTAPEALAHEANRLQSSFDLKSGPLFKIALFRMPEGQGDRLLLVVHHLVIDGLSWQILLEDFETVYRQLQAGSAVKLPPKTTSFKYWAERLVKYAESAELKKELDFWLAVAGARADEELPLDMTGGANLVETSRNVTIHLTAQETSDLLHRVPKVYNTRINDVLLAALGRTITRWTGKNTVSIDLEGHGREALFEEVDLSRTVGWFTSVFPVRLQRLSNDPGELLKSVRDDLRKIPNAGFGYGVLRYLRSDSQSMLRGLPEPQILFNYFGQMADLADPNRLLRIRPGKVGFTEGRKQQRNHLLEINAIVIGGRLQIDWTYSEEFHCSDTIAALANSFQNELLRMIAHCLDRLGQGSSPRKFRLSLDEASLKKITAATAEIV